MENSELSLIDPRFTDPVAAAEYLEAVRWPNGVICPHCGEGEREPYRLNSKATKRRLWKCRACRKQFTVMVGTIFESSHVPLNKWLAAFYLLCSSKKGMSAHQLHRSLKVTYKTAWFMFHRIREAMKEPAFADRLIGTVEADETYIGGKPRGTKRARKRGPEQRGRPKAESNKTPVLTLVERDGRARSFRMATVTAKDLKGAIREHVDPSARLMTDQFGSYQGLDREFEDHGVIQHWRQEYVAGESGEIHTQTVEGFFANLKRGITGQYHHVSRAHLDRYLAEFDFRWNQRHTSDSERTVAALSQAEGKRLKYRDSSVGRA